MPSSGGPPAAAGVWYARCLAAMLLTLAQFLIRRSASLLVRRALPAIFDQIDQRMPAVLTGSADGSIMRSLAENVIAGAIAEVTGAPARQEDIRVLRMMYDPLKVAKKGRRR